MYFVTEDPTLVIQYEIFAQLRPNYRRDKRLATFANIPTGYYLGLVPNERQ